MRVYYAGFNLYGQLTESEELLVKSFIDFRYDSLTDVQINHSYAVMRFGNDVCLHGAVQNETHAIQKVRINYERKLICVTSYDSRILLLYEDGTIFKLDRDKCDEFQMVPNFMSLQNEQDCIVDLACGKNILVALSKFGNLYSVPNKLEFENVKVVQIVVGREHCLLLDAFGDVYSFGMGSRGQLGHGCLENESEPKRIEALAGIKIVKLAAGGWHSCAVSTSGDLYSWGWNSNGQLGLGGENDPVSVMATPQPVDFDNNHNVLDAACGMKHTVVLLDNSALYGMGWNKYSQLGISNSENVFKPIFLYDFSKGNIRGLRCGPWSTAVLTDSD